jgi:hypothetical protein
MSEGFVIRHDLHIVAIALLILGLGALVHDAAGGAPTRTITRGRLSVAVPADWLAEPGDAPAVLRGEDAVTRLEIAEREAPGPLVSVETSLELERAQAYGPLYTRLESGKTRAGGRAWLRTVYGYAFKPTPTHAPRLVTAVEYAVADGGRLFAVTLHAAPERAAELERAILSTLVLR